MIKKNKFKRKYTQHKDIINKIKSKNSCIPENLFFIAAIAIKFCTKMQAIEFQMMKTFIIITISNAIIMLFWTDILLIPIIINSTQCPVIAMILQYIKLFL